MGFFLIARMLHVKFPWGQVRNSSFTSFINEVKVNHNN